MLETGSLTFAKANVSDAVCREMPGRLGDGTANGRAKVQAPAQSILQMLAKAATRTLTSPRTPRRMSWFTWRCEGLPAQTGSGERQAGCGKSPWRCPALAKATDPARCASYHSQDRSVNRAFLGMHVGCRTCRVTHVLCAGTSPSNEAYTAATAGFATRRDALPAIQEGSTRHTIL